MVWLQSFCLRSLRCLLFKRIAPSRFRASSSRENDHCFILHVRAIRGLLTLAPSLAVTASAADWPQFLGPNRNGTYPEANLAASWPKDGPKQVWQRRVGQGFSGPVVADGKLILFHRLGDEEVITCLDTKGGKDLWQFKYPATYEDDFGHDPGPRATPCLDGDKVFTFGADGMLHCLDLTAGQKLWSVDTKSEFGARKGFFGLACSPFVEGDRVFLNIGGLNGTGITAFDKSTGKLVWKATDHEAGYSSPIATTIDGQRQVLFFTRSGLAAADPQTGRIHWEFPWRARMHASVNAATPLVNGNEVFLSESYGTGAVLLSVKNAKPAKVWSSDDALSNHYATSVYREGFLYGYHGRQDVGRPELRCVEWKTGKVRWSEDNFGGGTVTLAGNHLVLLHEDGRLLLAEASPQKFKLLQQAQILSAGVRAHPALADGFLFARGKDRLACFDLRARGGN